MNEADDMFFDAKEFHTSNKQVANILSGAVSGASEPSAKPIQAVAQMEGANWGDDDEIDLDADNMLESEGIIVDTTNASAAGGQSQSDDASDIFVPPSMGADPL